MLTRLVKKKLIEKGTAPGNEKELIIDLTDLGRLAFENHRALHLSMLAILKDYYGDMLHRHRLGRFRELVGELSSILSAVEERRGAG